MARAAQKRNLEVGAVESGTKSKRQRKGKDTASDIDDSGEYKCASKGVERVSPKTTRKSKGPKAVKNATTKSTAAQKHDSTDGLALTKAKLQREAVDARKEKKVIENLNKQLTKDIERERRKRIDAEAALTTRVAQKLEAVHKADSVLLDDSEIRDELVALFRLCYQWASDWARKGALIDFLCSRQIDEIVGVASGIDGIVDFSFISDGSRDMIPQVEGGARLLAEGFLTHTICAQILMRPLLRLGYLPSPSGFDTMEDCVKYLGRSVERFSKDESRLLHARCVKAATLLHQSELEPAIEQQAKHGIQIDGPRQMVLDMLKNASLSALTEEHTFSDPQAREEIINICTKAELLSWKLHSQDVYIEVWGNRRSHLATGRPNQSHIIELHPTMKMELENKLPLGQHFDMFLRPAITARLIGDDHAPNKVWSKASGLTLSGGKYKMHGKKLEECNDHDHEHGQQYWVDAIPSDAVTDNIIRPVDADTSYSFIELETHFGKETGIASRFPQTSANLYRDSTVVSKEKSDPTQGTLAARQGQSPADMARDFQTNRQFVGHIPTQHVDIPQTGHEASGISRFTGHGERIQHDGVDKSAHMAEPAVRSPSTSYDPLQTDFGGPPILQHTAAECALSSPFHGSAPMLPTVGCFETDLYNSPREERDADGKITTTIAMATEGEEQQHSGRHDGEQLHVLDTDQHQILHT